MKSYKDRKLDSSRPIELYRCLNRKGFIFSIRQDGLVVAHTDKIVLKDCEFIVGEAGKKRCLKTKVRNVHAYVRGTIGSNEDIQSTFSFLLLYDPYLEKGFYNPEVGEVKAAKIVYIEQKQIYFQL